MQSEPQQQLFTSAIVVLMIFLYYRKYNEFHGSVLLGIIGLRGGLKCGRSYLSLSSQLDVFSNILLENYNSVSYRDQMNIIFSVEEFASKHYGSHEVSGSVLQKK